jgi:hypothetical protein
MANLVPKVNNVGTLGTSSKLWNNIFHKKATFDTAIITEESNVLKVKTTPLAVEQGFSVAGSSEMVGLTLTGQLALSTQRIVNVGAPTADTDAATKAYVDSAIEGLDIKESVRAATTASVTLASDLENGDAIDGITLATGDRILVKDQSTASENGIYIVAASGVPTRSDDMLSSSSAAGVFVFVEEGTNNVDKGFVCTANNTADVVGTHNLTFTQFSGSNTQTSLDNIASGTSASTLTTTAGNITLDAQGSDTDIIFKGTDGVTDTTFLTLDGSDAGTALFNNDIKLSSASPKIYFGSSDELYLSATSDGLTLRANSPDQWEPKLTLQSDYDGSLGPQLFLHSNSSSPAVSDQIGHVLFRGNDSGGNVTTYADMKGRIVDPTNGSERGSLEFSTIGGANMTLSSVTSSNNLLQLDSDTDLQFVGGGSIVGNGTGTTNIAFTINSSGQITKLGHDSPSNGQHLTWDSSNGYAVWSTVEVSADTTPQLGGNLDVDGNYIVSATNGDIEVDPNGSGSFKIRGNATSGSGRLVLNCENNSHGITLKGPPHSAGANYTLTLPNNDGNANQVLKTDGSGALSWVDQSAGGIASVSADTSPVLGGDLNLYDSSAGVSRKIKVTGGTLEIQSASNNSQIKVMTNAYTPLRVRSDQYTNKAGEHIYLNGNVNIFPAQNDPVDGNDVNSPASESGSSQVFLRLGSRLKSKLSFGYVSAGYGKIELENVNNSTTLQLSTPAESTLDDSPTFDIYSNASTSKSSELRFSKHESGFNTGTTKIGEVSGKSRTGTEYSRMQLKSTNGEGSFNFDVRTGSSLTTALEVYSNASNNNIVKVSQHDGSSQGLMLGSTLVTSTASEINLLDGGTSVGSSITIADTDGFVINDSGTMKSIPASDLKTYVGSNDLTSIGSHVVPSSANTYSLGSSTAEWSDLYLGDSSKIYFGNDQDVYLEHDPDDGIQLHMASEGGGEPLFKFVNNNSSANHQGPQIILDNTTADLASDLAGSIRFRNGSQYTAFMYSSGLGGASGTGTDVYFQVCPSGGSAATALEISGKNNPNGTTVRITDHNGSTTGLKLGNTLVTASGTELNLLDGATSAVSTTLVDADRVIVNDNGTMKQVALSDVKTYIGAGGSASTPTVITDSSASDTTISTTSGIEEIHLISNGSTAVTITLPAAATAGSGYKYNVKRLGTANVTIDGNSSETIDGSATFVLSSQYSAITLASDGSNWFVI